MSTDPEPEITFRVFVQFIITFVVLMNRGPHLLTDFVHIFGTSVSCIGVFKNGKLILASI